MRAVAQKKPNENHNRQRNIVSHRSAKQSKFSPSFLSKDNTIIQRKPTCPCGGGCPRCQQGELLIQTKLRIGAPNDKYEQEADRIADQVMRMPEPQAQGVTQVSGQTQIQRTCPECKEEEEESIQTKSLSGQITPLIQRQEGPEEELEEEDEETDIMTKSNADPQAASSNIQSQLNASKGSGSPLPKDTQTSMESAFGADFSGVRVHTDSNSVQMNRGLNAQAFTHGNDVYFNKGKYNPETNSGKQLLGHELSHVVQQSVNSSDRQMVHQRSKGPGVRKAMVEVRWTDDDRKFYHRVINAIARSRSFRGVPKASLWQPFDDPSFSIFRRLSRKIPLLKKGSLIKLRVSALFDPTVFHGQVTGALVETEQTARLRETKITGVLTPRETIPDRGPTEYGPAEVVDLSFSSKPSATAESLGGLKWFVVQRYVKSGSGTVTDGNDGNGTFTAGFPGSIRLELRVASGFSLGTVVSTHDITITLKGMIANDPGKPERFTITRAGLTPEMLADYLYGDKSKATAIWAVWNEKAQGEPFSITTQLPVGMWIGIEYRHLKPKWKKVFDASLDITSRKEWGAKPPILDDPKRSYERYTGPLEDILDSIVIHHAGNKGYKTMNEVQDYHMGEKVSADIGYHYGISLSGEVFQGRPIGVKGAHVASANTGKIGIVLLADLDPENKGMKWYQFDRSEDPLSPEMEASLLKVIHFLIGKYPKVKYLGGHKEFDKRRFCPGKKPLDKMSAWRSNTNLLRPA